MRLLIFGSRLWTDECIVGTVLQGFLAECEDRGEILTILDGKAPGADSLAGAFYGGAEDGIHGIHKDVQHERYEADWDRGGRSAGPRRNAVMAEAKPDMAVGFVDGVDAKGRPTSRGSGVPIYLVLRADGKGKR